MPQSASGSGEKGDRHCQGCSRQPVFFVVAGTGQVILTLWGIIHTPFTASLFFMVVVVAMGFELSQEIFRAARLSDDLLDSEERMSLAAEAANLGLWMWDGARDKFG